MSYSWKEVEGAEWANRARYNIYVKMRSNNISARKLKMDSVSLKKLYMFMSGQQDITVPKLEAIASALDMRPYEMFRQIPDEAEREVFPRSYSYE